MGVQKPKNEELWDFETVLDGYDSCDNISDEAYGKLEDIYDNLDSVISDLKSDHEYQIEELAEKHQESMTDLENEIIDLKDAIKQLEEEK